jgi:uncharacterized protein (DUF2267 family)
VTITGLDSLDTTLHKTNEWLGDVMDAIGTSDRRKAYGVLRGVLHALRDRLPVPSVAGLGAQLPVLVRGIYYDGWRPQVDGKPSHVRSLDEFLALVEDGFPDKLQIDPESAARAVFTVMERHLDPNETQKIIHLLPRPLQQLWAREVGPRDS